MIRTWFTLVFIAFLTTWGCDKKSIEPSSDDEKTAPTSRETIAADRISNGDAASKPVTLEDIQRDAAAAMETTAKYTQQTKDEVVKELSDQLNVIDAEIEKLRLQSEDLAGDAKAAWDSKMVEVTTKRESANAKLIEVKNSTANAWRDVEKGTRSAWLELSSALQKAANDF